jgi:molybdate transport system substrate-binding protein
MLRLAALVAAASMAAQTGRAPAITVSAAISLTDALQEVARLFEAANGPVALNLGASNVLARQIVNGAPVDVFISADGEQMRVVERAGLVAPGSIVPVVSNQLALVVPAGVDAAPESVAALAGSGVRRIAIGNPDAVPAGVYARQYLERVGLWGALSPKLLPSASVRAALAAVENRAAEAGIVYVTDARGSRAVRVAEVISGPHAPEIVYPACAIAASRRKAGGQAFLEFLQTAEARGIFSRHGFKPVTPSR